MSTRDPARPKGLLGDLPGDELSDACCWGCSGGGDVLCCDGCRAVYHLACIGLQQMPGDDEDYFCPLCMCKECGKPTRSQQQLPHIKTQLVPVQQRQLQGCFQQQQQLPSGPGYCCPQQLRLWLQQAPGSSAAAEAQGGGSSSVAEAAAAGAHELTDQQPGRAKRLRSGDVTSAGSAKQPGSSSSCCRNDVASIRCCCCQQACHVSCLPAALRQSYMQPPASLLQPRSPVKPTKAGKGKKKQQQQIQQDHQHQQQQQQGLEPYFCSPRCQQAAHNMAQQCAQGVVQVDALADGTPVSWQLIQPAAVAAALAAAAGQPDATAADAKAALAAATPPTPPKPHKPGSAAAAPPAPAGLLGTGIAAGYSQQQAQVLAQVLRDVLLLLSQQLGPAWEVRSFQDTLPWLVSGLRQNTPGGLLDLSHFHVAALWVGSTLASAALVRLHGPAVLEIALAGTLQQLQRRRLGRLLVACIERFALAACGVKQAWMPALGGVVKPSVGLSVLPTWQREPDSRDGLVLAAGNALQLLGMDKVPLASEEAAAAGSSSSDSDGEQGCANAQQQQQQQPKDLKACWALRLKYGPAPNVDDWMQLPKHMLVRFSYVPFVTKRLSTEALLPLPLFRNAVHAGPASATAAWAATAGAAAAAVTGAGGASAAAAGGAAAAGPSIAADSAGRSPGVLQAARQMQQHLHQPLVQPVIQQQQMLQRQQHYSAFQQQRQQQQEQRRQLPPRAPEVKQRQLQPLQPAFNFLPAQQLVQQTQHVMHGAGEAGLGKRKAAAASGIAAGIAAYNSSSSSWKGGVQQGSSACAVVGVSGVARPVH